MFNDISLELVNKAMKDEKEGLKVKGYVANVTKEEEIQKLIKDIKEEFGSC